MDELLEGYTGGGWPVRSFVLTFDDGLESFSHHALPVIAGFGFTAILFVVADFAGRRNDWPGQPAWVPSQRLMDWQELRAAASAGIEIGSHTVSHPDLNRLSPANQIAEIANGKMILQDRLQRQVRSFAYPYGSSSRALEAMVSANFPVGFGTRLGNATTSGSLAGLDRIDMYYLREPRLFRSLNTQWLDRYLTLRRWLREVRRIEWKQGRDW